MKKYILILIALAAFSFEANSQQISKNAIGLRLGDNNGFGTEINYQRGLSENNRLEFGLSWHDNEGADSFKIVGLFQWLWVLDGNFNWYVGAGGGVGQINFDNVPGAPSDETFLLATGDIGIEYNFDIPLLISLDFRPEIGFGDFRDDVDFDIGIGVRYQF